MRTLVRWIELDADNYQNFLSTNQIAIILFYSSDDIFTGKATEVIIDSVEGFDVIKQIGKVEAIEKRI